MRHTIRRIRNLALYLPPVLLLATAGALLLGLLYYPTPSSSTTGGRQTIMVMDENQWRVPTEDLVAILLADALRQMQAEQETRTRTRTLIYQYETNPHRAEEPAMLRIAPPVIVNGHAADRPVLIYL